MSDAKKAPQFIAGVAAALGALAAGAPLGWSSVTQSQIQAGDQGFEVNEEEFSWVGSLVTLGAAFMCIPTGILIAIFGRKLVMLLLVIPIMIGYGLLTFGTNVIMLWIARFLLGAGGGAFCVAAPMYTTEIAQVEVRGTLGSFFQLFLTLGVLFSYVVGTLVKLKMLNIISATLPVIFFIIFIFMPESPVWYVNKGKMEKANESFKRLRGKDYNPAGEIAILTAADAKLKENPVSLGKAFCRKVTLKSLALSISLMIFQQFSGINAIIFYSNDTFEKANTGISPSLCTILIGFLLFSVTIIAVFLVDKLGRRVLLLTSATAMAICTFLFGLYFFLYEQDEANTKSITWLPVVSTCLYIIFFSLGFGPVPWLVMAEVFTEDVKSVAAAIAGTLNWTSAFIVTKTFPMLTNLVGASGAFWVYTSITIFGFFIVLFLLPETKGRTSAEIQELLGGNKT